MSNQTKIPYLHHCNFCVSFHHKLFCETKIKSLKIKASSQKSFNKFGRPYLHSFASNLCQNAQSAAPPAIVPSK